MSLQDATDLVPDDLPDGAYWAMAHEMAGAEYGDAWGELDGFKKPPLTAQCTVCRKWFRTDNAMRQHRAAAHKPAP